LLGAPKREILRKRKKRTRKTEELWDINLKNERKSGSATLAVWERKGWGTRGGLGKGPTTPKRLGWTSATIGMRGGRLQKLKKGVKTHRTPKHVKSSGPGVGWVRRNKKKSPKMKTSSQKKQSHLKRGKKKGHRRLHKIERKKQRGGGGSNPWGQAKVILQSKELDAGGRTGGRKSSVSVGNKNKCRNVSLKKKAETKRKKKTSLTGN